MSVAWFAPRRVGGRLSGCLVGGVYRCALPGLSLLCAAVAALAGGLVGAILTTRDLDWEAA